MPLLISKEYTTVIPRHDRILLEVVSVILFLCIGTDVWGQSTETEPRKNETFNRHRLTLLMANSFIPAADNIDGQNQMFIVPTWGINYDYWFSKKVGVGLHNEFVLQQYKIEKSSDEAIIQRSFPVIISGVFLFKPSRNWILLIGAGEELEKHENLVLIKVGLEYGIELPHQWELSFNLAYDNKLDTYDSWMLGVGFSKLFQSKH